MEILNLFDTNKKPSLHIGLRMIKTSIAVFICAMIGYARGGTSTIFSMITAIICIQPTKDKSLLFAFNRVVGTVLGAALGAVCLLLAQATNLTEMLPLYYFIVSLLLIPLIKVTLLIRKPTIAAFACVVFLSVTMMRIGDDMPLIYVLNRTLETLIGIAVGLFVNWVIPMSGRHTASHSRMSHDLAPAVDSKFGGEGSEPLTGSSEDDIPGHEGALPADLIDSSYIPDFGFDKPVDIQCCETAEPTWSDHS